MAKSANYFGLRKGSTKSHTFSVVDGKQITKDRVEGGKNPRTYGQMIQRCLVATNASAYSAMKSICDHSFQGVTAGRQSMGEFMTLNMKQLQLCKEYGNGFFGFNKYQEPGLHAGSFIISDGSLPDALVDAEIEGVNVSGKKVIISVAPGSSIADIADAMGCKNFDDICTIALMYPKANGSYGFAAVRFTYKRGATVLESFHVDVCGDAVAATPTFASNLLKVEIRMAADFATTANTGNTYMAAITSRKVNGTWLRSKAQFDVTEATPTFAEAIATYPVGKERFLNGGEEQSAGITSPQNGNVNGNDNGNVNPNQGGGGNGGGNNTGGDSDE